MVEQLTKEYFDEQIETVLRTVKEGFDHTVTKEEFEERFTGIEERVKRIDATMVTKNYLDDKLADLKGDLIVKLRKTNDKLDFVIALLRRHNLVSDDELRCIRTEFQIFPSLS